MGFTILDDDQVAVSLATVCNYTTMSRSEADRCEKISQFAISFHKAGALWPCEKIRTLTGNDSLGRCEKKNMSFGVSEA